MLVKQLPRNSWVFAEQLARRGKEHRDVITHGQRRNQLLHACLSSAEDVRARKGCEAERLVRSIRAT